MLRYDYTEKSINIEMDKMCKPCSNKSTNIEKIYQVDPHVQKSSRYRLTDLELIVNRFIFYDLSTLVGYLQPKHISHCRRLQTASNVPKRSPI